MNSIRATIGQARTIRSTAHIPSVRASISEQNRFFDSKAGTPIINDIKPKLLESKIADNQLFFGLSDGFKRIFANDKKDSKMIIPICGYGGHRRGDRSQNYFGKSFRDVAV